MDKLLTTGDGAKYRQTAFSKPVTICERRGDGSIVLRSGRPLPSLEHKGFAEWALHWSRVRSDQLAFSQRDHRDEWRSVSWAQLWSQTEKIAAGLLDLGLEPTRPVMVLSGNSIEQAILVLAAEYVGIPVALISPAYSTQSTDLGKLRAIEALVQPGAIFVQQMEPFKRAIDALRSSKVPVIAVEGASAEEVAWECMITARDRKNVVECARAAIVPDQIARILFTSGSTGVPKGVPISFANLEAVLAYQADALGALQERKPVLLDWLPWHHAYGGILTFGLSMYLGAAFYIDEGRPVPGQFQKTIRNLREIAPTIVSNVPLAWTFLANELEKDNELAQNLFANVMHFSYGGAALPKEVWRRIQDVAEATVGERIAFCTGLASTETAGGGTYCSWPGEDVDNIGVPKTGSEIKLVPLGAGDERYEIRVRSRTNFTGYLKRPDLTAAAFDDEGYFRLGDAVRFANESEPDRGLRFAGRIVEDFKLSSGTWVRTGAVRLELLNNCAPLVTDAVICGHDREFVTALAWLDVGACRALDPDLKSLNTQALIEHPAVRKALQERLKTQASAATTKVQRIMLLSEAPSADANEIADKGYVNQAAVRDRRAHLVEELYSESVPLGVIAAG